MSKYMGKKLVENARENLKAQNNTEDILWLAPEFAAAASLFLKD
ncbi:MAG: hypothetical protein QM571_04065 [Micrococcaceae bacterium]